MIDLYLYEKIGFISIFGIKIIEIEKKKEKIH
jgi:hypothetical protein